ncbi:MAG: hypothetical protein KHX24_10250, partial [Clostridiales bacterium]|nr:hypothetical protein [Clostridiales bacterium]
TIRLWNGKEKTGRHDLSAMPSCDNQITSLWGRALCRSRLFIQFLPHMGRTKSWEKTLKKCGDNQSDGRERKKNFTDFVIYITQDLWYTLL